MQEHGNVSPQHDAHDELMEQNVLAISSDPSQLAREYGIPEDQVPRVLEDGRRRLREHRERERPRPALDDKIVVAWNGLAIGALARSSAAIAADDPQRATVYREAAERAVWFICKELLDPEGNTLKRVFREGPGDTPGFADDYAFLISGLLDLYEATFNSEFLSLADALQQTQIRLFWDADKAGFFSTAVDAPDLLLRLKDGMDNAEPSTNGVSAQNLQRLGSFLEDEGYSDKAVRTAEAFEAEIMQHPSLFPGMMPVIVASRLGMRSIVITGDDEVDEAVNSLRRRVRTNSTVIRLSPGQDVQWLKDRNPLLRYLDPSQRQILLCENHTCRVIDRAELERVLDGRNGEGPDGVNGIIGED